MTRTIGLGFVLTLALGGCASIAADDQVKDLQTASTAFGDALRAADTVADDARRARSLEEYRADVYRGLPVAITTDCRKAAEDANHALDRAIAARPYDPASADGAYATLTAVVPCDFPGRQPSRSAAPIAPAAALDGPVAASGSDTLSGTAGRLDAYVAALADVATGETADGTDAARAKLVTAGKGLLAAVRIGGAADAIVDVADQAIGAIVAAKRNAATRAFLEKMDVAMPVLMERIGLAARVRQAQAALDRARAAESVAGWANQALNAPGAVVVAASAPRVASPARMALFDEAAARLEPQDEAFLAITATDPMGAARAFAAAHHALTAVYGDPRANRAALAEGLASFQEAASALDAALTSAKDDGASR